MATSIGLIQFGIGRFNGEFSSLQHRIFGIDCQIENDLLNLPGSAFTFPKSSAKIVTNPMSSPMIRRSSLSRSIRRVLRSRTLISINWRRLKARIFRIKLVARSVAFWIPSRFSLKGWSSFSSESESWNNL